MPVGAGDEYMNKSFLFSLPLAFAAAFAAQSPMNSYMRPSDGAGSIVVIDTAGAGLLIHDSLTAGTGKWSTSKITADSGVIRNLDNTNVAPGGTAGYVFGTEYMYHFNSMLMHDSIPKVCLIGNSTVEGGSVANYAYQLENLFTMIALNSSKNVQFVNMGVSGTNTKQWVDSLLPIQLAQGCDVYMVRYGINDAFSNRADFAEDYLAGFETIRDHCDVQECTVMALTPNSTDAVYPGADSTWDLYINPIIRNVARNNQATFIDLYTFFRDAVHSAGWMDSIKVHPLEAENLIITGVVGDVMFPRAMSQILGPTTFINPSRTFLTPSVSNPPQHVNIQGWPLYSKGLSMYSSGTGWPHTRGGVFTMRQADTAFLQFNTRAFPYGGRSDDQGIVARVGGVNNYWSGWRVFVTTDTANGIIYNLRNLNTLTGAIFGNESSGNQAASGTVYESDVGAGILMNTSSGYGGNYGSSQRAFMMMNTAGPLVFKAGGVTDAKIALEIDTSKNSRFYGHVAIGSQNESYYVLKATDTLPIFYLNAYSDDAALSQTMVFASGSLNRSILKSINEGTSGSRFEIYTSPSAGSPTLAARFSNDQGLNLYSYLIVNGSITTQAPTTGTAAPWKLGSIVTAACVLDATTYAQIEINGVFRKVALCQ